MGNVQVFIVDDYPEMRQLLRDTLHSYSGISVIGEAATGEDAVAQVKRLRPTVVIIDFQLPTMSGIEATKLIKRESPSTAVIGLTAGVPDDTEKAMLAVGAAAVLDKADILQTLHPKIVEVVKGLNVRLG
jgi:two-component system, NarL family, invasion response regulator UvrY